jgi:hypothetical protein
MRTNITTKDGVSILEIIVAVAVLATIMVASSLAVIQFVEARANLVSDTKTLYLAEEGYELLRTVRDNDWTTLSGLTTGSTYYFLITGTTVSVTTTPELVDGSHERSFVLQVVERDGDDDIVPTGTSGATLDTNVLEATVTVTGPAGTKTLTGILANIHAI